MRPRYLAPLLVALALSADMAAGAPVIGRVTDGEGRPIAGVEVRLESTGLPAAVTGADGAFALAGLAPRRDLELSFCHRRYLPATRPLREAPDGPLAVTLAAGAEISGRVADARGMAVAGAAVAARRAGTWPRSRSTACPEASRTRTDADGRFSLMPLPPGWYTLEAGAPGFRDGERRALRVPAGDRVQATAITLDRGRGIAGRVVAADGSPVAGARVTSPSDGGRPEAISGADGRFVLSGADPGPITLVAVREGYATGEAAVAADGPRAPIEIVLHPGPATAPPSPLPEPARPVAAVASLDGADHTSPPLQRGTLLRGRVLGVAPGEVPEVVARNIRSDGYGEVDLDNVWTIPDLPPGDWTVSALLPLGGGSRAGRRIAVAEIRAEPGAAEAGADLDFRIGDLTLTVTLHGSVPEDLLALLGDEVGTLYLRAEPAGSTVRFPALRAGRYRLEVASRTAAFERLEEVDLTADREVAIDLEKKP